MKDFYSILGVPETADEKTIKQAYKKLARKYHPDHNKDDPKASEKMTEVNMAYDVLGNKEKRVEYDASRNMSRFNSFDAFGSRYGARRPKTESDFQQEQKMNDIFENIFGFSENRNKNYNPKTNFDPEHIFGKHYGHQNEDDLSGGFTVIPKITIEMPLEDFINGTTEILEKDGKEYRVKIAAGTRPDSILSLKNPRVQLKLKMKPKSRKFSFNEQGDVLQKMSIKKVLDVEKINVKTILDEEISIRVSKNWKVGNKIKLKDKGWKNSDGSRTDMFLVLDN